jgi:acylphosphatase
MIGRKVLYEGRVQGVGFRYSVKRIATGFEVTGSVINLDDGRVELRANGEESEVDAFIKAIRESELGSLIKAEHASESPADSAARGFNITF